MKLYETTFIARQDMAPSQVDLLTEKYSKIITDHGGSVVKTEYCGLRLLAYTIKKNTKGHYVLLSLKVDPDAILEIERQMRLNSDIIRYLSVVVDKHKEGPSSLLKSSRNSNIRDVSITFSGNEESESSEMVKEGETTNVG